MSAKTIEYRPKAFGVILFSVILIVTAGILLWVGQVVRPGDRAAMDGFTRILFTVVPIRLFTWVMAAVFVLMAIATGRRLTVKRPTLVLSDAGIETQDGSNFDWSAIKSAVARKNQLVIELDVAAPSRETVWQNLLYRLGFRNREGELVFGELDLGDTVERVAEELESRMTKSA